MQEKAKQIVVDYFNSHVDKTDGVQISIDDVRLHFYFQIAALRGRYE